MGTADPFINEGTAVAIWEGNGYKRNSEQRFRSS